MTDASRVRILGLRVSAVDPTVAVQSVVDWASGSGARRVAVANVHMIMEAWDALAFREIVDSCDLVVPDGMPLVWALRALGVAGARRVRGPDLVLRVCRAAREQGLSVGLYGGSEPTLHCFEGFLAAEFPGLLVGCAIAPPFRPLTQEEDEQVVSSIRESEIRILFVGLGCPKQERWMAAHRDVLDCVMIGVGAAFDLYGGKTRHAPTWMQSAGLEWLFRLATEPRRLWKRYLKHNPRFLVLFALQYLGYLSAQAQRQR